MDWYLRLKSFRRGNYVTLPTRLSALLETNKHLGLAWSDNFFRGEQSYGFFHFLNPIFHMESDRRWGFYFDWRLLFYKIVPCVCGDIRMLKVIRNANWSRIAGLRFRLRWSWHSILLRKLLPLLDNIVVWESSRNGDLRIWSSKWSYNLLRFLGLRLKYNLLSGWRTLHHQSLIELVQVTRRLGWHLLSANDELLCWDSRILRVNLLLLGVNSCSSLL